MSASDVAGNLRESFRAIASSRAGGEVRELAGVSIASAGVQFQMFNAAFLSSPVSTEAELGQRILLASLHFSSRGQEWAYWAGENWLEGKALSRSRQIFERYGLRHSVNLPGMVADRVVPPLKPLPEIEVRRVCGPSGRDAFCGIGSACFHVPFPWFQEVFDAESVWRRFAGYVGYVDGEAVCTAATVMGYDAIGVYNVATLPDRQRRGYGEAVMRYALAEARREHGIERSILQSTPAGYKMYERMGYRTVTRVAVYAT